MQALHGSSGTFDGEVIHQVVAQHAGGVADSLRMGRRFRVQQNASGLERSGGYDHYLGVNLAVLVCDPVDVVDTFGASAAIEEQVADNRVAHQGELASARRRRQSNRWAVEVRSCEAAALALVAVVA